MRTRLGIVVIAGVVLGACGSSGTTAGTDGSTTVTTEVPVSTTEAPATTTSTVVPNPSEQAALDAARARWADAEPRHYTYVVQQSCECSIETTAPHVVVVRNGSVVHERLELDGRPPIGPAESIDEVFGHIQNAINHGTKNSVTYDGATGAPLDVQLDLPSIAADGGISLQIELTDQTEAIGELDAAEQRWADSGIVDYDLEYRLDCFCPDIVVTAQVIGAEVDSFTINNEAWGLEQAQTVPDLFAVVRQGLDRGAASVSATYDPDDGHPSTYFIDEDRYVFDEEHGVTVVSLTPRG